MVTTREPPHGEAVKNAFSDNQTPLTPPTKTQFMNAHSTISTIEDLFTEAGNLFAGIPPVIQTAILAYHNEHATIQHTLRWGVQAAKELREDWHAVVAGIPCALEKGGDDPC